MFCFAYKQVGASSGQRGLRSVPSNVLLGHRGYGAVGQYPIRRKRCSRHQPPRQLQILPGVHDHGVQVRTEGRPRHCRLV